MKKKSSSKWKWAFWGLVLLIVLVEAAPHVKKTVPNLKWKVPVQIVMPPLADIKKSLPDLPEIPKDLPSVPKIGMPNMAKWEGKIENGVEDILNEIPSFSYEVGHEPKAEPPAAALPPIPTPPPRPPEQGKGVRIAIIIDDMGLVPTLSARAVKLPGKVTLAYLPYASHLEQQTETAMAAGHDLMLHMPMEPLGNENPGPMALKTGQTEEEWKKNLDKAMASFDGYLGVNNHMGSKFTADPRGMAFVAQTLKEKGAFFIDSRTNAASRAGAIMHELGVRSVSRDVFLDDTQTQAAVRAQLAEAERIARKKGFAVAIGHPHAVTLIELERWLPEVQARGYQIVPVRTLVE